MYELFAKVAWLWSEHFPLYKKEYNSTEILPKTVQHKEDSSNVASGITFPAYFVMSLCFGFQQNSFE